MNASQVVDMWTGLVSEFQSPFTRPGGAHLGVLLTGGVLAEDRPLVTESIIALGRGDQWRSTEWFLEEGKWPTGEVERKLCGLAAPAGRMCGRSVWALDDMKALKTGQSIRGACSFHEYTSRCCNRPETVWAHNWVVCGALEKGDTNDFFPTMGRLYVRESPLPEGEEHRQLPIVMVTALDSQEDRQRAVQAGADDFVAKPVQRVEVEARVSSLLRRKEAEDALRAHRDELERQAKERTAELRRSVKELTESRRRAHGAHLETLERLAIAAEYRDEDIGAHVRRVGGYCALIGERLHLSPGKVEVLRHACPLHDVGKIGIPDSILLKPRKLEQDEWGIMKQHTVIGACILSDSSSRFLQAGYQIALTHHEKWDGSGYPKGLEGEDIPLYGCICAVADVFDALTSDRPHRDALPVEKAIQIMKEERGKHFNPELLDLLLGDIDEVLFIREKYHLPDESGP